MNMHIVKREHGMAVMRALIYAQDAVFHGIILNAAGMILTNTSGAGYAFQDAKPT